jgi:AcrR family transcriptional regulator
MTTSSTKRPTARSVQAAETRQRLIEAAVALFSDHNYDDVAVGDIAKSVGVAHGLLFHYFGSKRGIYLEAMGSAAKDLDAAAEVSPDLPAGTQVREIFAAHLRYIAKHQGLALRLVLGGRGADAEAWSLFEADRWHTIERVATSLGLDPNVRSVRMMLRSAVGGVDEATIQWLESGKPYGVEKMVEVFIKMTVASLRAAADLDARIKVDNAVQLLTESAPLQPRNSRRRT